MNGRPLKIIAAALSVGVVVAAAPGGGRAEEPVRLKEANFFIDN